MDVRSSLGFYCKKLVIKNRYKFLPSVNHHNHLSQSQQKPTSCLPTPLHCTQHTCLMGNVVFVRHSPAFSLFAITLLLPLSLLPSIPLSLSQVQPEDAEVAGRVLGVHHGGRRHRHEHLVSGPQLEQAALVDGVQRVLGVGRPALGPHALQQLDGPQVVGLLVDALDQLVAGAGLVRLGAGRRVAEVHLGVQVVAAVHGHAQAPVGQGHVAQVRAEAAVAPGAHRVAARLVQVWLGVGVRA